MKHTLTPVNRHGKWGFANSQGQIIIPCLYDEVVEFSALGYVTPVRLGRDWRFITYNAKIASAFAYDVVKHYYWRRYLVQRNGLWGFVNNFGQEVVLCQFEDILPVDDESLLVFGMVETPVCFQGKWGIINDKGHLVLPCAYEQIRTVYNGTAEVRIGNKWQCITFVD